MSRPLVITRLFIIWVSLVNITLPSDSAVATRSASSVPWKNRVSYPIILSHLASFPALWSTMNLGVLINSTPLDSYLATHPLYPPPFIREGEEILLKGLRSFNPPALYLRGLFLQMNLHPFIGQVD